MNRMVLLVSMCFLAAALAQAQPGLTSPANNSLVETTTPTLHWNILKDVNLYVTTIYANKKVAQQIAKFTVRGNSCLVAEGYLVQGQKYWWNVAPKRKGVVGKASPLWSFTVSQAEDLNRESSSIDAEDESYSTPRAEAKAEVSKTAKPKQPPRPWTPLQLAIWKPIQISNYENDVYGVRANVFYGVNRNVYGLDVGVFVNSVRGDFGGVQLSMFNIVGVDYGLLGSDVEVDYGPTGNNGTGLQFGLLNTSGGFNGLQMGMFNMARNVNGLQFAFLANNWMRYFLAPAQYKGRPAPRPGHVYYRDIIPNESVNGVQLACYNIAGEVNGVQVGFINRAEHARGIQLGLVNYTERMGGLQVGALNIITEGKIPYLPIVNLGLAF